MHSQKQNETRILMNTQQMIKDFKSKQNKYDGYVYLISDGTYIKIGHTKTSIKRRIEDMQTGNANKLEVLAYARVEKSSKLEKYLHDRYKEYKHRREWFRFKEDGHIFDAVDILRKSEKIPNYVNSLIAEHEFSKEVYSKKLKHAIRNAGVVG